MSNLSSEQQKRDVTQALAEIARMGPVRSTGTGDMAVGKTLLDLLGIPQETSRKPTFLGMVLTARRGSSGGDANRVNLFAMVPSWNESACKSSREIAQKYGYDRDGGRKLYVSVSSRRPNAQGLQLFVERSTGLLREIYVPRHGNGIEQVASWKLSALQERLLQRHPASAWLTATASRRDGEEYFHYRFVKFTDQPRAELLPDLLEQGTVTMDHLILCKNGRDVEKGPLFKINPSNVRALFPEGPRIDLMTI